MKIFFLSMDNLFVTFDRAHRVLCWSTFGLA
jgi:hypothetical protein